MHTELTIFICTSSVFSSETGSEMKSGGGGNSTGEKYPEVCTPFVVCSSVLVSLFTAEMKTLNVSSRILLNRLCLKHFYKMIPSYIFINLTKLNIQ